MAGSLIKKILQRFFCCLQVGVPERGFSKDLKMTSRRREHTSVYGGTLYGTVLLVAEGACSVSNDDRSNAYRLLSLQLCNDQ